ILSLLHHSYAIQDVTCAVIDDPQYECLMGMCPAGRVCIQDFCCLDENVLLPTITTSTIESKSPFLFYPKIRLKFVVPPSLSNIVIKIFVTPLFYNVVMK
ncbi:hypothetical protein PMAYCL1PPCAC_29142, partial [Pristionchus mayeri]